MKFKFARWQKLGLVLTCLWVFGSSAYLLKEANMMAVNAANNAFQSCAAQIDINDSRNMDYCNVKKDEIRKEFLKSHWQVAAQFSLLSIPCIWVFLYLLVITFKLIARGKHQATSKAV